MSRRFAELAFTPLVKEQQEQHGSRRQYARMEEIGEPGDRLTDFEREFIAERDGFYMASTGETGWPYIQYRGGEKGFLHVLDDQTLGFADLRGNKQYISAGNLQHDDRVALFLMDYPRQQRLKILGRAVIHENDAAGGGADCQAAGAGGEDADGACGGDPCGGVRLELPAAHYSALHPGRAGGGAGADAATHGSAGSGECAAAEVDRGQGCEQVARHILP